VDRRREGKAASESPSRNCRKGKTVRGKYIPQIDLIDLKCMYVGTSITACNVKPRMQELKRQMFLLFDPIYKVRMQWNYNRKDSTNQYTAQKRTGTQEMCMHQNWELMSIVIVG
jgi:hypothetical protein